MLKSFGRDFVIYGVSSSIAKFIGVFLVPLYTRYFTTEEYGSMDLIVTAIAFISIMGTAQLESAVSRFFYAEKDKESRNRMISTALWSILILSFFFFILLMLFAGPITSLLLGSTKYQLVFTIACMNIPFVNLNALLNVLIRFKKKPAHYLIFQSSQALLSIGITIVLITYFKTGIIGVFIGQLSGFALIAFLMGYYLRKDFLFTWDKLILKKMLRYSLPLVPAVGGSWANSYVNRFVMLGYLSVAQIGIYAVALKVASIFSLIGTAFRMAWSPFFWDTYENNPDHKVIFKKLQQHISILVLGLVSIIILYSNEIIYLFATSDYYDAANLVGMLALSIAISNIIVPATGMGPGITKKTEYNTIIYFTSVGVNIASLFLFVPILGLLGVPLSLVISSCVLLLFSWYNSERLYPVGFNILTVIITLIIVISILVFQLVFSIPLFIKIMISIAILISFFFYYRKSLNYIYRKILNKKH